MTDEPINGIRIGGKRPPQIAFGEEFESWDDARKIRYLKALASSMNEAARDMQEQRNEIAIQCDQLKALAANADKALHIQKTVTINQLRAGNEQVQALSKQIQELQVRIKAQDAVIEAAGKG